jgi:hypothetical protein
MRTRSPCALLLFAAAVLVAGCATTNPNQPSTWRDPSYNGPGFRKVFVVGLSARDLTDQRGFEDLLVATLQRAGVTAVPGWQFVPTDREPDQATMRAAVARAGADAVLLARLSGFATESDVVAVGAPVVAGVGGVYGGMYGGWYQPTAVANYQVATVYTTLFDVRTASAVWTFNAPTYNPATLQRDAPRYADDVVGQLMSAGLLAPR